MRSVQRAHVTVTLAVAALCALGGTFHGAETAGPRTGDTDRLAPGTTLERELSSADAHTFEVQLTAGQFVDVVIEQRGIDVSSTLVGPDGGEVFSANHAADDFHTERILAIADKTGTFTIHVRPAPPTAHRGRYLIRVEELRAATPQDAVRVEAAREYERGRTLLQGAATGWPEAQTALAKAVGRFRDSEDRAGEMEALTQLSAVQQLLLRPEALASAQQAERTARELNDKPGIAAALYQTGRAYERAGDLVSALNAYEESTAISRAIGNRRQQAISLNSEGIIYGRTGDAERAVGRFEEALPLARATNLSRVVSFLFNNMGMAYKSLGRFDKALNVYEQALADRRAANDRDSQAALLMNIGNLENVLGDNAKALELQTEALRLARETGRREYEATSLNTIGITHYELGDYAQALDFHRQALAIRRDLGDLPGEQSALHGVGRAARRLGDLQQASAALAESLTMCRQLHDDYETADTLSDLAAVERDRGDLDAATRDVSSAVDLEETMRDRITSPELRTTFAAAEHSKYELLINVLLQRHHADPAAGYDARALQVSERARARVLLESLLDARVDLRQGIDPALLERERSLQKQLSDASAQLTRSLGAKGAKPNVAASDKLDRLTAEYQKLQATVREQSPHYAALTQPRPLDAAAIQQSVLDSDTVLLEFALGDERSWLWAVTPGDISTIELPARGQIDAAARALYERLTARQSKKGETPTAHGKRVSAADRRLNGEAASLSRVLFGGIAARLHGDWRGKRLAIVAAGALEYLPFSALPEPAAANSAGTTPRALIPLGAHHEVVRIPSASVLAVLRRETAGRQPAPRTVAILADPVFTPDDPRVKVAPATANPTRSGLARLPFSRGEAEAIARLAGPRHAFRATDFAASRHTVLNGTLSGYRIVHFATHGVLDSERPALSGLVLSLVDERGVAQDGYLRLHDIYNMRLDADLVVLSACQTALGKQIRGEGLVGLARAFMYAGAPRVVASLWEVSDLATAELMTAFYRAMLEQHLRPAAALRAAQLHVSQDPRWRAPYYWAGFVLEGDWK